MPLRQKGQRSGMASGGQEGGIRLERMDLLAPTAGRRMPVWPGGEGHTGKARRRNATLGVLLPALELNTQGRRAEFDAIVGETHLVEFLPDVEDLEGEGLGIGPMAAQRPPLR